MEIETAEQTFLTIIQTIFSEAFAMGFLVGLVLFIVGFLLCGLYLFTRIIGKRVSGKVIGAVMEKRTKIKTVDGEKKEKIKETLYPVYEYIRPDGSTHQERGSEGGTSTYKYVTGQNVNLIVSQADGYDDVYDANNHGALILGLIIAAVGMGMMLHIGSIASAFGMGLMTMGGIIVIKLITGFAGKDKKSPNKEKKKYSKAFNPEDVKPIESFERK